MKKFIIIALVIVVIVGGVYLNNKSKAEEAIEEMNSLETETARIDSIIATVGATGTVRTNQTATLTWEISGNVEKILFEVGDQIKKGDVLAILDETSVPQNVVLAKADILSAENGLEALFDSFDDAAVARTYEQMQEAWKVLEYAEDALWNINQPYRQASIDHAEANLVLANDKVVEAKKQYEKYENSKNETLIASLKVTLASAELSQDSAENTLYIYTHGPSAYTIANYEADLQVAQTNYAALQKAYDEMLLGPEQIEVEAAEARITAAEMTLDSLYVYAPFDATITETYIMLGDAVNPGSLAFRIDDYSRFLVDVNISEVDVNKIYDNQKVSLTFDAMFEKLYEGYVVDVAYVGNTVQGMVSFEVTIEVSDPDDLIKPGMTAGVYITIDKLENVLIVPNRAVRVVDGERVIYVMENGSMVEKKIVLGMSSDFYSEVLSGELEVGDEIILNPPSASFGFGMGMGMGR